MEEDVDVDVPSAVALDDVSELLVLLVDVDVDVASAVAVLEAFVDVDDPDIVVDEDSSAPAEEDIGSMASESSSLEPSAHPLAANARSSNRFKKG